MQKKCSFADTIKMQQQQQTREMKTDADDGGLLLKLISRLFFLILYFFVCFGVTAKMMLSTLALDQHRERPTWVARALERQATGLETLEVKQIKEKPKKKSIKSKNSVMDSGTFKSVTLLLLTCYEELTSFARSRDVE